MQLHTIRKNLVKELSALCFTAPVTHVYNPLEYAGESYDLYFSRYGKKPKEIILLGMNPGPWGMAQTGVPFGEIAAVRDWLKIEAAVGKPGKEHPKRPVQGFSCSRSEVSGRRLWGWAAERFGRPEKFFARFLPVNYCPLLFMEESGRNRTPDKLPKSEKNTLFRICDSALRRITDYYRPQYVVGVGAFAAQRAKAALKDKHIRIGRITHPSPANPKANRGWAETVEKEFAEMGIRTL
ncbi:MAG: uracil-DNA glycosylase family protein [Desulfococcaceae bacterium]|nr:uracil-DNA glycosylase family protein [Desulfococcaceae bacterium]